MSEPRELPVGHPPEPGWTVRHYEILSEIGRGGMGILFRARNRALGSVVALKCPRPELAGDAKHRRRFLQEAQAAARLSHPNIVPILDAFEEAGIPWIVEEFVEGQSLRALLTTTGPLSGDTVARYGECLAEALAAAHAKHILHRDVKPSNVLVTATDRVLLTDFGLARVMSQSELSVDATTELAGITSQGQIVGTPQYMAPEQAKGQAVDVRTDLFSLGLVLYEMCTGVAAFRGGELGHVLDAIMHREPEPISRFSYEIPAELERIVRKAIAKRPDERYQSANDMAADLRSLRRKYEFEAYSENRESPDISRIERLKLWLRHHSMAATLIMSLALSGLVILGVWRLRPFPTPNPVPRLEQPIQVTSSPYLEQQPALSPDGTRVAYVSTASGNLDIWVSDSRGGPSLQLTNDPASDFDPTWLPDGSHVIYASDRGGSYAIWKVPQFGGPAILVVPGGDDPAVSPDGTRLAFSRSTESGHTRIAMMALAKPEDVRILTGNEDGLWDHSDPAWSPDGKTLCYATRSDLWLLALAGGSAEPLTRNGVMDQKPVWTADGKHIYFSSYREGSIALWRARVADGHAERVTLGSAEEESPSLSRDGKRLAYATREANYRICIRDRKSGREWELRDLKHGLMPALAPDGRALAFVSDRWGTTLDLWCQTLAGVEPLGPPRRLTEGPGDASHPAFSPDGRWIAYYWIMEGRRDLWVISVEGGKPNRITDHAAADIHPAWSPMGDRLAFCSDRSGTAAIWTIGFVDGQPFGEPIQFSPDRVIANAPAWSPDGTSIAFIGSEDDGYDVWIVQEGRTAQRLTQGAGARRVRWDAGSDYLLVSGFWAASSPSLRRVARKDGASQPIEPPLRFGFDTNEAFFDVTPDGRLLTWCQNDLLGDIWTATVH